MPKLDAGQRATEPNASYKNSNRPQNTMLKLVDVTGSSLTTMSTQPLPHQGQKKV
ncbi:MAG TPA: hypothetical protein VJ249_10385 [Candidatus Bathyarchaeia archaeon]|nr:hypothetical protein [Candidatus Bathyarchaeia archaeon]